MKIFRILLPLLALGATGVATVGCGDSGGPDPKVEQARVDQALEMRKLFDKVGGDYAKLDPADKAAFEKYAGGAESAQKTWTSMKFGTADGVATPPTGSGQ